MCRPSFTTQAAYPESWLAKMVGMTSSNHRTVRYGYKASAEQFPPRQLVDYGVSAEDTGFYINFNHIF